MTAQLRRSAPRFVAPALAGLLALLSALPCAGAAAKVSPRASKPAAGGKATPLDPLATRLCAALHTFPEERRAQCCATAPASTLAAECGRALSAALRGRALRLDPPALERCAADSDDAFAGCDWVTPLRPRSPDSCAAAVVGLAPAGAACTSSLECQDGLSCQAGGTKGRVCAAPRAPGSACGTGADPLVTYLRDADLGRRHPECAGYCLAGRCAAWSPLGQGCSSSRQCAPGQHCGGGVCQQGATATTGEACTGTSCGPGSSCQQGKCAPLKSAGAACSSPFECRGACLMAPGAAAGTCGMKCNNGPLPQMEGPATPPSPASSSSGAPEPR